MVLSKKLETATVTFGMIALTFTVCNKKDQHVPFLARLLNNEMAGRNSGRADPGFRDDLWIDMKGSPISSAATMTERMSRPSYGKLNVEITIDDPKMYTKRRIDVMKPLALIVMMLTLVRGQARKLTAAGAVTHLTLAELESTTAP